MGLKRFRESIRPHEKRALGAQLNLAIKSEVHGIRMEHAVEIEEHNHVFRIRFGI
jgi:hypothetical protein